MNWRKTAAGNSADFGIDAAYGSVRIGGMATVLDSHQTYYSAQEAAIALGVSDGRIRQMLLAGEIVGKKHGERMWAIPSSEIERLRRDRGMSNPAAPRDE